MAEKSVTPLVSAGNPRRARIPLHRAQRWIADAEKNRKPGVEVFVTQAAFRAINDHANSDLDNEVGGWLAGRWCRDIETKAEYIVVEALLPAQQVRSGSTFLTFTHDSQVAMLSALEEKYSKKGIIGWYHTHPRMGIFLSGYDVWLHDHFFPHLWQIALVIEPHSKTAGFFIRNEKGELDSRKYHGFYELLSRTGESTVDWQNFKLEKKKETKASAEEKPSVAPPQPAKVVVEPAADRNAVSKGSATDSHGAERSVTKASDTQPVEVKRVVAPSVETKAAQPSEKPASVMRRFEAPRPPAKVNLTKPRSDERSKDQKRKNGSDSGSSSEEATK
jgi:proteasome lid subunit RPN8/RPN11